MIRKTRTGLSDHKTGQILGPLNLGQKTNLSNYIWTVIFVFIYICVCMCVCVCIRINIKDNVEVMQMESKSKELIGH